MDDDDLEAFRGRIRAHRRKQMMAKAVGVAIGLFGLVPAFLLARFLSFGDDFSGRVFWLAWAAMLFLGGVVWRFLEPKQHVDEIE